MTNCSEPDTVRIGDVVELRSGGHSMTVKAVDESTATCMWSLNGNLKLIELTLVMLQRAKPVETLDSLFGEN